MSLRILITRPQAESALLASQLASAGHHTLVAPMLTILPQPLPQPDAKAQAVVFTSRHAVTPSAALAALPAFCIGPATAEAAQAAGFTVAAQAQGDRGALVSAIAQARPKHILFLSGADERGDIVSELAAARVRATRCVVYRAQAATTLADDARLALQDNALDLALLFSARSAATFTRLADAVPGFARQKLQLACFSSAVAEACGSGWASVAVARAPTLPDMLACAGLD